jgi:hypothetical protein
MNSAVVVAINITLTRGYCPARDDLDFFLEAGRDGRLGRD